MAHRYFSTDIATDRARITGPDAAHLARVLRVKTGSSIILCNGSGTDYDAVITAATPEEVTVKLLAGYKTPAEPTLWADVFIGYAKGERMDWAVQKSVELGASGIYPFYSENTVVKPPKGGDEAAARKTLRLQRIANEAAKQCGRGILPQVYPPMFFKDMLAAATQNTPALFLYEEGGTSLQSIFNRENDAIHRISIITGAEGGFSPAEARNAAAAGCIHVGLGPRILRCETAPAAVLSAVMLLTGNLE